MMTKFNGFYNVSPGLNESSVSWNGIMHMAKFSDLFELWQRKALDMIYCFLMELGKVLASWKEYWIAIVIVSFWSLS